MKIGLVDLDSSHAVHWPPLLRNMGHEVVALCDSGAVHPKGYAEKFAAEHGVSTVCASPEELEAVVDCAVLLGCDWNNRLRQIRPFVENGKSVLIDKPVAGHPGDLRELQQLVDGGARITGGSALRFCYETRDWLAQPEAERGKPQTVFCGCGNHEFFYGIHAAAMLLGIMGTGVHSVRHLGNFREGAGVQRRIQFNWEDGRSGIIAVGPTEKWMNFFACIVTGKGATQYRTDASKLYQALFEKTLPFLSDEIDVAPLSGAELIEPEMCLLAARYSQNNGDREIILADLPPNAGYDSDEFLRTYSYS
jgi:hypothetical protein